MTKYSYTAFAESFPALVIVLENHGGDVCCYMEDVFIFPVGKHYLVNFRSEKDIDGLLKDFAYEYEDSIGLFYKTLQYKDDKVAMPVNPVEVRESPIPKEEE